MSPAASDFSRAEFPEISMSNDQFPESPGSPPAKCISSQAVSKLLNSASSMELRSGGEVGINYLETLHPKGYRNHQRRGNSGKICG